MKKALSLLLILTLLAALALPALAEGVPELTGTAELSGIEKYGNVKLSLSKQAFFEAGYAFGDVVTVRFLDRTMELPVCSNYSDVDAGQPALFARDADEAVSLAINMGDFATACGLAVKTTHEDKSYVWSWAEGVAGPVAFTIRMKEAGAYLSQFLLHQVSYTYEREDYAALSDEQYANFRAVETTGMGEGVLYRTSSPIDPKIGRSACADAALRAAGVTVVMNLADDEETARAYPGFDESYYAGVAFIALNMSVDLSSEDFNAKLADGLRFFAANPGVYAVHCTEGKDRAGFVSALLECLMGASLEEVSADYMRSFENYYGVKPGDERYNSILSGGIVKTLSSVFGVSDLPNADLAACADAFFRRIGLDGDTIAALKKNLSAAPTQAAPETQTAEETEYTVVAGDCLWDLANRFYGRPLEWKRISDANGLKNPGLILIGQRLRIPA